MNLDKSITTEKNTESNKKGGIMEKRIEIKKSISECRRCIDMAEQYDAISPCESCHGRTGTWIDTVSNFWGTYAVVCIDDESVEKVPLDRIKVMKNEP